MVHRQVTEKEISITEDGTPIFTCCYSDLERPTYFHPLYAPNGQVVTEGEETRAQYPPGISFTLGTANGEPLNQQPLTRQRMPSTGETSGEFTIVTTWRAQGTAADRNLYSASAAPSNRSAGVRHRNLITRTYNFA